MRLVQSCEKKRSYQKGGSPVFNIDHSFGNHDFLKVLTPFECLAFNRFHRGRNGDGPQRTATEERPGCDFLNTFGD